MKQQTAMMVDQNEASKRIENLTVEQAAIARRQGEIAELQHRAALADEARAPVFRGYPGPSFVREGPEELRFIRIVNLGNKTADYFVWQVVARTEDGSAVRFAELDGTQVQPSMFMQHEGHMCAAVQRISDQPLPVGLIRDVLTVSWDSLTSVHLFFEVWGSGAPFHRYDYFRFKVSRQSTQDYSEVLDNSACIWTYVPPHTVPVDK